MAELGSYYITIMPSMKGFTNEVKSQLGDLGTSGGKSYSNGFMSVLKGTAIGTVVANLASKVGGALMDGLDTGISRLDTLQNFPKVMEGLGYSTQEADRSIRLIMDHLDGLPTATQDMVTLTQAISDSTGDLDLATRAALGFNDMMLANGASSAEMAQAQGVLNRILGKGSATVAQWQSLTSVMPAQLGQVARHMLGAGASTEDLHKALEEGTVSWQDFLRAVVELDETGEGAMDSFYKQAINNSKGIGTALENIPNRIGAGWAKILGAIGQEEISGTIDKMSYGIRDAMYRAADGVAYLKEQIVNSSIGENLGKIGEGVSQAFQKISDAAGEKLKPVADGLVYLIDNGLQWFVDNSDTFSTIGDIIGTAFDIICTSIEKLAPVAQWLWEEILQPLGEFLGGIFVEALNMAKDGLQQFLDTIEQADFTTFVETLQGAKDAIVEFFTGMSETVTTAFETIKQWLDDMAGYWDELKTNLGNSIDGIKQFLTDLVGSNGETFDKIKQNLEDNKVQWEKFKTNVGNTMGNLKSELAKTWGEIKTNIGNEWSNIQNNTRSTMSSIQTEVTNAWNNIKTNVTNTVNNVKQTIENGFNQAKSAASSIFQSIANDIQSKMQWAHNQVSNIISNIKGLFNFSWSLPAPRLPHINWHMESVAGLLSIPVFDGISWYAKGGIFDAATLIGVGEAGREAALPLNRKTYGEIARGITEEMGGGAAASVTVTGNTFVIREEADIDRIAEALSRKVRRETGAIA